MCIKFMLVLLLCIGCKTQSAHSDAKEVHNANVIGGISTMSSSDTIGTLVTNKSEVTLIRCPFRAAWGWPSSYYSVESVMRGRTAEVIGVQLPETKCRGLMINNGKASFVRSEDLARFKHDLSLCIAPMLKQTGGWLLKIDPQVWVDALMSQPGSNEPTKRAADSYSYDGEFINGTEKCVIKTYASFLDLTKSDKSDE